MCHTASGGLEKNVNFQVALDAGHIYSIDTRSPSWTTLDRFRPNKKRRELTQELADFVELDMGKVEVLNYGLDVILSNGVDGVDKGLECRTGGDLDGGRDNVKPVLVLCSRHCCQCL